jgi:hypothetical protein
MRFLPRNHHKIFIFPIFFERTVKAYAFPNFYKKKRVDPVYKENRVRKPYNSGRSTAQLGEQRTPNDSGPQTIQLSTLVGWIGTSTRTAQLNNSSVGLGHRHDQLKELQKIMTPVLIENSEEVLIHDPSKKLVTYVDE